MEIIIIAGLIVSYFILGSEDDSKKVQHDDGAIFFIGLISILVGILAFLLIKAFVFGIK